MPEHGGDLVVAQLLEVPQGEHLAVDRVQAVEGLAHPGDGLAALAAWLGEVRSPINSAILSELASIAPPRPSGTSRAASRPGPRGAGDGRR